jgi:hypothetical protein
MKTGSFAVIAPLVLLIGVPVTSAQQSAPQGIAMARAQRPAPQPPPQPPQPPATAPAPAVPPGPAALSVPNPLAGFRPGPRDLYRSPDGSDRFQHLSQFPPPPVVVYPGPIYPGAYYPFGYAYPSSYYETSLADAYKYSMAESYLRRQHETARGGLAIQAAPLSAQVFVDGHYAGLAEAFGPGGGAMTLSAGAHRIELRAPDYETLEFEVLIEPNGLVRYRGDMERIAARPVAAAAATPPRPPAAAAPAKSFYVIPNCYAGDKPPSGALPKGCDLKNLQTRK